MPNWNIEKKFRMSNLIVDDDVAVFFKKKNYVPESWKIRRSSSCKVDRYRNDPNFINIATGLV
ncbi:hypothetical protein DERP_006735 [Dermatophagoides pteronyssinus]|uniref:Uncharacterized protein n=1 Tax=Dermatophagoides pteronyssinus TaxID=6956 RepID=A0ABQ8IRW4_DERPT|nr:hypothetical protein DERP_006735 [Dermatophagoides pteronyssinus]